MLRIAEMCVNLHPNLNFFRRMRQIKTICLLLLTLIVAASCLNSSNDDASSLYSDAAITSFSLGTLTRYQHQKTDAGNDTIIKTTVTGSSYDFSIDQINHRIYNADSLPTGTDVSKLVVTLSTYNGGTVWIQDLEDPEIGILYNSTDSIDFTTPRTFRIYANNGKGFSTYTVNVNVHQQEANVMNWQLTDEVYTENEETPNLPEDIKVLLGGCSTELYALSTDNRLMVSRDDGATWEEDLLDEDPSLLPVQDLSLTCYQMGYAENTDYVVLVGNRSTDSYPQESTAVVWRKIVDHGAYVPQGRWTYITPNSDNPYQLPRLKDLSIVKYDDGILAIGGEGIGGATQTPWSQLYQSRDNGITWKENSTYQLPAGFNYDATKVLLETDGKALWLYCSGTGQVWRGQLNKLGWEKYEE